MLIKETPWGTVQILKETLHGLYDCLLDNTETTMDESDIFIFERNFNFNSVDAFIDQFGNEISEMELKDKLKDGLNGELIIEGLKYLTHHKFIVLYEGNQRDLSLIMKSLENFYKLNNWHEEFNGNLILQFIKLSNLIINIK